MGWKKIGDVFVYVRPIKFREVFNKIFKSVPFQIMAAIPLSIFEKTFDFFVKSRSERVLVEQISEFDFSFSDFLDKWNCSQSITAIRSVSILNWRFFEFKDRGYKVFSAKKNGLITGYMVLRVMPMQQFLSVALVDLIAIDRNSDTVNSLVDECLAYARTVKADLVATAMTNHHLYRGCLVRKGFIKTSKKFTVVTHFPKNTINLTSTIFKDWFINWFDHDFV
jgi:hypothetical protein